MSATRRASRGFLFADVLIALVIVGALAAALATGVYGYRVNSGKTAQLRRATAVAERVLNELQLGRRPEASVDGADVRIERIERIGGGDAEREASVGDGIGSAPRGFVWVRVVATFERQRGELIGLCPRRLVEGEP